MQDQAPTPSPSPADNSVPADTSAPNVVDQTTPADPAPAADATPPAAEPQTPAPAWPDDWRQQIAGADEKELKQLERVTSPKALWERYRELQKKLSSGEFKSAKPKGNTPEELAEWRKENGIPEEPTGYELKLPNGLVVSDEDKPMIDEFVKTMHGVNATPEVVNAAVATYYELQEQQLQQFQETNASARVATEDALRQEWGGDYRRNINAVASFIDTAPGNLKEEIFQARMPDGTQLMNNPEFVRWLAQTAREINPAHTVVPGAGSNSINAIADEIAGLEKKMGDRESDYWKGPNSERLQARYRELITARERMK